MALKAIVLGSQEKELDGVLRSCGVTPMMLPVGELAALAQPSVKQPDLLLLDLREHPAIPPGLAAFKRVHPTTGVIIVAKALDPELMLSAMRAGANECVAEPLTQGEMDAAITRVVARKEAPAASQMFAFVGVKGGVGTTSLAVNVATALARVATAGTLFIDLQIPRGEAALYLGLEPRFTILDALENIHKLDEAFFRSLVVRGQSRLDLLAAPDGNTATRLDGARLRTLLDFTAKQFEFTVLDVPRTEPAALEMLDGVKSIIVVTTQDLPAVRSASIIAGRLRQRYGKDRVLVVMNRKDKLAEIRHEDVEQALGGPLFASLPSDYRLSLSALEKGQPIVLDNHNPLAASYERFARTLAGLTIEKADKAPKRGLWSSLTGR